MTLLQISLLIHELRGRGAGRWAMVPPLAVPCVSEVDVSQVMKTLGSGRTMNEGPRFDGSFLLQ